MALKSNHEQAKDYLSRLSALGYDDLCEAMTYKWFRLNTLYFIKDKNGKKILFEPNQEQEQYYTSTHGRDIILKARQLGFTTFAMISALDDCLFTPDYAAGCIAHNLEDAKDIFRNKIRFAYRNISDDQRQLLREIGYELPQPINDKDNGYVFDNGSSIKVSVSYRGGTLQSLHVSEFGKICRKFPDKAKEIVTGAFEAVGIGNQITIESTAEGRDGYFYDYCSKAKKLQEMGVNLSPLDFNFHFFPWWMREEYRIEGGAISSQLTDYFTELEGKHGVKLDDAQKAWYSAKWSILGDDMKREYPSTPEEAFAQSIDGAYYAKQFANIYADGRICESLDNDAPVNTAWDIGVGDSTAIWFYQSVGNEIHLIDYYENSGEGMEHYFRVLKDKGYSYKYHYAPHDIENREFGLGAKSRKEIAMEGFEIDGQVYRVNFQVVPRKSIDSGIEDVRQMLARCVFDRDKCELGIKNLESYRKEWDDKRGCWKDRPLHDYTSHCFTGETEVLTRNGTYQIMDLPSEGEVMTLWGWKKYRNPRLTRKNSELVAVAMKDGTTVKCTPDHKWLTERGWRYAKDLERGSRILSTSTASHNTLQENYTGFIQARSILRKVAKGCTEKFGKMLLGRYQKGITYTIKTETKLTTTSKTLSFFLPVSTYLSNGVRKLKKWLKQTNLGFQKRQSQQQQSGTGQKREGSGIGGKLFAQRVGKNGKESRETANGAVTSLNALSGKETRKGSAMPTAKQHFIEIESVTKITEKADVYCMTVPEAGHFSLANGAVVHNCADAFRYLAAVEQGTNKPAKSVRIAF